MEMDSLLENKNSHLNGISRFSDISNEKKSFGKNNQKTSPDEFYTRQQVIGSFLKISSFYSNNLEIKNDYIVVTFD